MKKTMSSVLIISGENFGNTYKDRAFLITVLTRIVQEEDND
jgi:hypothetical protein